MKGALVVAGRDLRAAWETPTAHLLSAAFLLVSGAVFSFFLLAFSEVSEQARALAAQDPTVLQAVSIDHAVVEPVLRWIAILLLVLVPLLTMHALAEEARQGTMELLLTAPISPAALVVGKFLGALGVAVVPFALTGFYPLVMVAVANPDPRALLTGYLGLLLLAAAYTAIGLFASSLTSSPPLAAFLGFGFLVLSVLAGAVGNALETNVGTVLAATSLLVHFDAFTGGVIDTGDVVFFACVVAGALFATLRVVESHRWR